MQPEYVRRCPTCGLTHPPQTLRCACGGLLMGVDLVALLPDPVEAAAPAPSPPAPTPQAAPAICPHDDCGQANAPQAQTCVYCNRPMAVVQTQFLQRLPQALQGRYVLQRAMPTRGAEADLLLVSAVAEPGVLHMLKLYRHGLIPRADVQQRVAKVDPRHSVRLLETGLSEGHAYELMEYCPLGSLRQLLGTPTLSQASLPLLVRELNSALAAVHQAGLLHRDLKPENVLVRALEPLDLVFTDFGTASILEATQRFTSTARSLPYASPESLSGVIDAKTDYWALGMMVLEASTGRHPFAGLSEAVILHQLATRNVDLSELRDTAVRKLLRGLLQRDPQQRWGASEVARWLARDPSLPEPAAPSDAAEFKAPYHLGAALCHTPAQLAVAMANDWETACHDMSNGLLQSWFREVQKDHNTLRLLIDMRQEHSLPHEVQLLRLILHLAPGIAPVWRGRSVELPALLALAAKAMDGDEAAVHELRQVHEYRVLEIYAQAGNAAMADIWQRWGLAAEQYGQAWDEAQALLAHQQAPVGSGRVEDLLYAAPALNRPSIALRHAQLLALAYDAQWTQGLRNQLSAHWTQVLLDAPWLSALGDPAEVGPARLLVLQALLPQAREAAARAVKQQAQRQQDAAQEVERLQNSFTLALEAVREGRHLGYTQTLALTRLTQSLEDIQPLIRQVLASADPSEAAVSLRRKATRVQRGILNMQTLIDDLQQRRTENKAWFGLHALGFALLVVVVLPMAFGAANASRVQSVVLAAAAGVALWRYWPTVKIVQQIREVAAKL